MDFHFYHLESDVSFDEYEKRGWRVLTESDSLWSMALDEAVWPHNRWDDSFPCFEIVALMRGGHFWNRYVRVRGFEPSTLPVVGRVRGFSLAKGSQFETPFSIEALTVFVGERTKAGDVDPATGEDLEPGLLACEVF